MLIFGLIGALFAGSGILAQDGLELGKTGGIVAPNYIIAAKPPTNVSLAINTFDLDKRNVTARSLYGIMHEDISHSGDGGIYAELLINRAFQGEPQPISYRLLVLTSRYRDQRQRQSGSALPSDFDRLVGGWRRRCS